MLRPASVQNGFPRRYHNDRMINYDSDRGVRVTYDKLGSTLLLENASADTDSGNYTCSPDNIRPSSVIVHVLSEGNSAAAVQNSNDGGGGAAAAAASEVGNGGSGSGNGGSRQPPSAAVQSNAGSALNPTAAVIIAVLLVAVGKRDY